MNEDLIDINPIVPSQAGRPCLPKMIAISLAFHSVFAIMMVCSQLGGKGTATINYIDLTVSELQSVQPKSKQAQHASEVPIKSLENEPQPEDPHSETEQLKQNLQNAVNSAVDHPEAIQKASFGLGLVNGHFGTIADGKTLREDMREYYLSVLKVINEKWWIEGSRYERIGSTIINIVISRNGEIVKLNIIQSSGNHSYDRALLKSLERASPVPPLPVNFDGIYFMAPIRFNPPLKLLSSFK